MAGLPELTDEQRRAALAKAAEARRVRADVKNRLKMGSLSLSELLAQADDDVILAKMKVLAVLESCLLYTSPSPRDYAASRMPSSA